MRGARAAISLPAPMRPISRTLLVSALGCALAACTLSNEGIHPPAGEFHYPVAAVISPDANWLYVVNSDFDLKYNGGRVNVLDLARVRACISNPLCRTGSTGQDESAFLVQGSASSIQINPFATGAVMRAAPSGTSILPRLYITVRGDGTLTWIDVDGPNLVCGQAREGDPLCDVDHRVGHTPSAARQLVMPPLPVTLNVGTNGPNGTMGTNDGYILVVHQESPRARASLFWENPASPTRAPELVHWLGDLSPNLDAIVRVPLEASGLTPHYYVFSRLEPTVNQLRIQTDGQRSFLYRARGDVPQDLAVDVGVRAAIIDPCNPHHVYATSRPQPPDSQTPVRSPEQLIDFDITDPELITVAHTLVLPTGPSNLVAVPPVGGCGTGPVLVYTVSYDARKMFVIDVDQWREFDQIRTERGPHVPVLDPINHHIYLIDFASMVIQVIDVDPASATFNQVLFTIGDPVLPAIN